MLKCEKPKSWPNVPFKTWQYQGQTEMKHRVFSYYLPIWLHILGSYSNNLNYVDGFGGIGAYHTDKDVKEYHSNSFGSPILSISKISELENKGTIKKANTIIIDEDGNNLENLKKILEYKNLDTKGKILFIKGDFDREINSILDQIDKLAPTFFLIDPFGIKIKIATLERIMSRPHTEILLNFMYNALQRFIDHPNPQINTIYDDYFGDNSWRKAKGKYLKERENELINTFKINCKKFSNFVYPYRLCFPDQKKTYYYLFHLTKHRKGCCLMKESFARFNGGKDEYLGKMFQSTLFDEINEKEKRENFIKKIDLHYKNKTVKYSDILDDWIDNTDLLEQEIKKLLQFQEKKLFTVEPFKGRKRRGGIEENDKLVFISG